MRKGREKVRDEANKFESFFKVLTFPRIFFHVLKIIFELFFLLLVGWKMSASMKKNAKILIYFFQKVFFSATNWVINLIDGEPDFF